MFIRQITSQKSLYALALLVLTLTLTVSVQGENFIAGESSETTLASAGIRGIFVAETMGNVLAATATPTSTPTPTPTPTPTLTQTSTPTPTHTPTPTPTSTPTPTPTPTLIQTSTPTPTHTPTPTPTYTPTPGPTCTPTPTPTPTSTPISTPTPTPIANVRGDASGDGTVSLVDAHLIKEHILRRALLEGSALVNADANQDAAVDVADIIYVLSNPSPPVIAENVVSVDSEPSLSVVDWTSPTLTLSYSGSGQPDIQIGDVIVGSAFNGFLRRVSSINIVGSLVTVETSEASQTDAVVSGQTSTTLVPTGLSSQFFIEVPRDRKSSVQATPLVYDLSGTIMYQDSNLTVDIPSGMISFEPTIDIDLAIEHRKLDYFRAVVEGALDLSFDVRVDAKVAGDWSREFPIPGAKWTHTAVQFIGQVPVVEVITVQLVAKVDVDASAAGIVQTGFDSNVAVSIGAEYSDSMWQSLASRLVTVRGHPVDVSIDGQCSARATVAPELSIAFYAVAGPEFALEPYLEFQGQASAIPPSCFYSLDVGIDAILGFNVGILDASLLNWEKSWSLWSRQLPSGSCLPPATPTPAPNEVTVYLPCNVPLTLVRIPAGSFQMGSPNLERSSDSDEGPVHTVTIGYDFYMGKYEITQQQWQALMRTNPSQDYGVGDNYPVYYVSWNDCQSFLSALNTHITNTGQGAATFRLPSEAEWEYSCRAGTQTRFFFGDSLECNDDCSDCAAGSLSGNRSDYMWYCGNQIPSGSKPVGTKLSNQFGLYDMSGNIWEWCQDWHHSSYSGAPTDGSAWESPAGSYRVVRGGTWSWDAHLCRSASRHCHTPDYLLPTNFNIGMRVLRTP